MNTVILQNLSQEQTSLFKKVATALRIKVQIKKEKEPIYNSNLLKAAKGFGAGETGFITITPSALREL